MEDASRGRDASRDVKARPQSSLQAARRGRASFSKKQTTRTHRVIGESSEEEQDDFISDATAVALREIEQRCQKVPEMRGAVSRPPSYPPPRMHATHFQVPSHHTLGTTQTVNIPLSTSVDHDPHSATEPQLPPPFHSRRSPAPPRRRTHRPFHIEIGADTRVLESMEGVEQVGPLPPLVVLDGANVAYAYGQAQNISSTTAPNLRGIQIAVDYFERAGLRTLVVLESTWARNHDLASLVVAKLVLSPPADDDDAYALTVCRRENSQRLTRQQPPTAYVLSNDHFRDAQARDATGRLQQWLEEGYSVDMGPGRISYAFADMGHWEDDGSAKLDLVPNPRHPLVQWVEGHHS